MRLLFIPAIALMNRLGYTKKFLLLALVFMNLLVNAAHAIEVQSEAGKGTAFTLWLPVKHQVRE